MHWRRLLIVLATAGVVVITAGLLLFAGGADCEEEIAGGGPAIRCSLAVAAPPEAVWEAFTRTDVSRPDSFDAVLQAELVAGGRWRFVTDDRERLLAGGTVLAVEPPRRFAHSFAAADLDDPPSRITVTLEPEAGGTRVTLVHDRFPRRTATFYRFRRAHPLALAALGAFVERGEVPLRARVYTALFEPGMKLFTRRAGAWDTAAGAGIRGRALRPLLVAGLEHGFPGIAVAVSRDGEAVEIGVAGLADLRRQVPLTPDHAFHLASVTKLFTAAAVLRLVDRGRVSLSDRVVSLLGEEAVAGLPWGDEVTVEQLLDHSSGFAATNNDPRYIAALIGPRAVESAAWTAGDFVELAAAGAPFGPPGSGHFYSDTNYVLLGEVVATVAGRSLAEHVRATLFEPLGLESAYFFSTVPPDGEPPVPTVRGYLRMSDLIGQITDLSPRFPVVRAGLRDTTAAGERIDGAAAIVATVGDLHRFMDALLRGDLLSAAGRRRLLSVLDGLEEEPPGTSRQEIVSGHRLARGVLACAEGDGPGGSNVQACYHPESDTLVVAMVNLFGLFDEAEFLRERVVRPLVAGG